MAASSRKTKKREQTAGRPDPAARGAKPRHTKKSDLKAPVVSVIMGSRTDYDYLLPAIELLTEFRVAHEVQIVSAHRTPQWMTTFARQAASRGVQVIIAGAGGAAHLPGMVAANTILPVLGVPIPATLLNGLDSLLSIVQMPKGVPVGTLAIGKPGAANAALLAISILALRDRQLSRQLQSWRDARTSEVLKQRLT